MLFRSLYCEGRRQKFVTLVKQKKLVCLDATVDETDDTLMAVLDRECSVIHKSRLKRQSEAEAFRMLWQVAEEEILAKFEDRKIRNSDKNKPERFQHLKPSLEFMRREKADLFEFFEIKDINLDIINKSKVFARKF